MTMNRRGFFTTAAATGGTLGLASCGETQTAQQSGGLSYDDSAELKLSLQERVAPGETLAEKLDFMEEHGYVGMEISGGGLTDRVTEIQDALSGRNVKVSAICAGFEGFPISSDPEIRNTAIRTMKELLVAAGELGSTGLIYVPAFHRDEPILPHEEARAMLVDILHDELGPFAAEHNTRMLAEPLNRRECYFLRLVADAAAIARDSDSPGSACMGDFWHMTWEETSDMGAFISGSSFLHHVHIASRKERKVPGEDEGDNYVDGFKGLKVIGYNDYVSFECGVRGDPKVVVADAAKMLREQWDMA